MCTCVHAHKRFWSCRSAKQFRFRVCPFCLDLRFTVLRWPLCFNIHSRVCSCSEPSANFCPCCPRCILKFFSLCISWKPENCSGYKRNVKPFPHPLFVLNTVLLVLIFNKTVWTSKCLNGFVGEFCFPMWIKIYGFLPKQSAMLSLLIFILLSAVLLIFIGQSYLWISLDFSNFYLALGIASGLYQISTCLDVIAKERTKITGLAKQWALFSILHCLCFAEQCFPLHTWTSLSLCPIHTILF